MVSMAIHQLLGVKGRPSLRCGNIFGLGTATRPLDLLQFLNPVTVLEDLGFLPTTAYSKPVLNMIHS